MYKDGNSSNRHIGNRIIKLFLLDNGEQATTGTSYKISWQLFPSIMLSLTWLFKTHDYAGRIEHFRATEAEGISLR